MKFKIFLLVLITALLGGCASEKSRAVQTEAVKSAQIPYSGVKMSVSVGRFSNQSSYNNGIFSDG